MLAQEKELGCIKRNFNLVGRIHNQQLFIAPEDLLVVGGGGAIIIILHSCWQIYNERRIEESSIACQTQGNGCDSLAVQ